MFMSVIKIGRTLMKNSFPKSENEINLSGLPKSEKIAKEAPFNDGDAERK